MIPVVDELLLSIPDKFLRNHHDHTHHLHGEGNKGGGVSSSSSNITVDILDTPKEYIFFFDVPGLSKSDIQVTVEDDSVLVVKSNGKRKRDDDEEGVKYIRLERKAFTKFVRKFRLAVDSNLLEISAKCENGVLTVTVGKLPPAPKPKAVEVSIS